ncbi:hypothetical protein DPMN_037005 [Dreissena polymorpha]|uniref:Uncharacterized protein n=1 Tax=Dreissena polymorpha TaxID=45954 RepID=A0A9D4MBV1_DREPO|nr:hypothetical protein DPMN_037005 [Dreissena polymorpha]
MKNFVQRRKRVNVCQKLRLTYQTYSVMAAILHHFLRKESSASALVTGLVAVETEIEGLVNRQEVKCDSDKEILLNG